MNEASVTACGTFDVGQIPSVPGVVLALIDACNDRNQGFDELARIARRDMGLCARIFAVSRPWPAQGRVGRLAEVISSLGVETVRAIAVTSSVQQFFSRLDPGMGRWLGTFWRRSPGCAHGARMLADLTHYEFPEEAYFSGLFHGLGKLLFLNRDPESYQQLLVQSANEAELAQGERHIFGHTAIEVGAMLIRQWDPHSMLSDAVLYQSETVDAVRDAPHLVRLINLACRFNSQAKITHDLAHDGQQLLGLAPSELEEIQQKIEAGIVADLTGILVVDDDNEQGGPLVDGDEVRVALARRVRESAQLDGVRRHLAGTAQFKDTLMAVFQDCGTLFGVYRCVCFLSDDTGSLLTAEASTCLDKIQMNEFCIRLVAEGSLIARALLERDRLSTGDIAKPMLSVVDRQLARLLGCEEFICLPLYSESEDIGVLVIGGAPADLLRLREQDDLFRYFGEAVSQVLGVRRYALRNLQQAVSQAQERHQNLITKLVHEANNPLAIIKNYLQVLSVRLTDQGKVTEQIDILNEEIGRVADIIARMQEAPVVERGQGAVDINELARDLIGVFRVSHFTPRGIVVVEDLDRDMPRIMTDRNNIKQVLTNLLKNAAEGMAAQGRLTVSTRDQINVNGSPFIELVVEDDGPGIPREMVDAMFRPVRSRKGGGTRVWA